ncbi:MAG: adenylate/guanylate cyclase domain-containing protein [Deltaproteobacteria bacterium]|nr:adenylate/guanylate cyclase domain-containing protein [Deltaproteobacteria bacterium]
MNLAGKRLPPFLIAAVVATIFSFLTLYPNSLLQFIEAKTYDWRFHLRGTRPIGSEVVIVAIDEKSIAEVGRWPWSRSTTGSLIESVARYSPAVIGIDMIFSEPEKSEGLKVLGELKKSQRSDNSLIKAISTLEKGLNADLKLESSLKSAGNVVLPIVFIIPREGEGMTENREPKYIRGSQFLYSKEGSFYTPYMASRVLPPLEPFANASAGMGHIYTSYDNDGTIRWEPLSVNFKGSYYPSFGLEVARLYMGIPKEEMGLYIGDGVGLGPDGFIPTDESGKILINYAGPPGTVPIYSAVDVLSGSIPQDALKDKAVLIGTTAIGTYDIHVTPYANMPGVEKQAAVVENIIHGTFLERAESQWLMVIGFIIASGIILAIALQRMRAFGGAVIASALFCSYLYLAYYLFTYKGLWIDFITPTLNVFFLYASITGYRYMTEERKAREIKGIFSSYVTEKVVNELVRNPEMAKLGGSRREITVLFSDIRGFTTFSEKHQPEEVVAILNEYLKAMTDIVFRWDGTLDKFVGDAVMVFWNAPTEQKDHAERAVRCALDMISGLKRLQEKWAKEGKEALSIGIGINTGEVVVGNMGAEGKKMDYTVIGDPVNLGARAEGLTRHYDTNIVITEFTYRKLEGRFNKDIGHVFVRELDSVKVKGKDEPVVIYGLDSIDEILDK